jgi:myo-inositol-1(or 4)-monophosphatase
LSSAAAWGKAGNSIVSEADIALDRMLAERLRAARPDYGWRSEEEANPVRPGEQAAFVVDPIDGTRDFLAGGNEWTIALAVVERGRPRSAVVFAPVKDELFAASVGDGASLNGKPIHARKGSSLAEARVAGPRRFLRAAAEGAGVSLPAMRFVPSLAYRITLVAAGTLDVAIAGPNAHDWDLAAADLLVHEAGAVLIEVSGTAPVYGTAANVHPALIAASPILAREVALLLIARKPPEDGP